MIPHFEYPRENFISLIDGIRKFISKLPDKDGHGRLITCHAVCRCLALSGCFSLEVVDGYFGSLSHQHSWLKIIGNDNVIIDAYPWSCVGGPIVVDMNKLSPWHSLYREEALPYDIVQAGVDFCIEYFHVHSELLEL